MKYLLFYFFICFFYIREYKDIHIPWYINERIQSGVIENYNFLDSLNKYGSLKESEILSKNKYLSYLSDLEFKTNKKTSEQIKKQLEKIFENDKREFCEQLIKPALEYVKPNDRPFRRYSRPFITELDFDYFLNKCIACDYLKDSISNRFEIGKITLSNVMLNDQWFRIPSRIKNDEIQKQYDLQNIVIVDKLFQSNSLDLKDDEVRSNIFILLLHSSDCEWTKKWL